LSKISRGTSSRRTPSRGPARRALVAPLRARGAPACARANLFPSAGGLASRRTPSRGPARRALVASLRARGAPACARAVLFPSAGGLASRRPPSRVTGGAHRPAPLRRGALRAPALLCSPLSVPELLVHHVQQGLAALEPRQILEEQVDDGRPVVTRERRRMRRNQRVRSTPQRMVRR